MGRGPAPTLAGQRTLSYAEQEVGKRLAENLYQFRVRGRMSQERVADHMRKRGHKTWSRSTVSEIERNRRRVYVEEMFGLAQVLSVPYHILLQENPR